MQKFFTHRTALLAGISCLISVIISIASYRTVGVDYQNRLDENAARAKELASYFASETVGILQYADTYVQSARREYLRSGLDGVRGYMDTVSPNRSIISHITIIDGSGRPVFNSVHEIKPGVRANDRDYFIFHRDNEGDVYLSLPQVGRNSGLLTVRYARRITNPDGSFGGVIFAAMETEPFTGFFAALNLGPASSATLVGNDRKIRARSSYGRLGPGQDISGSRLWQELETSPKGLYLQTSVVDGITRYYAYERVEGYPLIVAIGLALNDLEEQARGFRLSIYAIAGLSIIIVAALALFAIRDGYVAAALRREIGQRRRSEAELEAVNTDLTQFANSASHDLKAPLASIAGLLKFCVEDIDSGETDVARGNLVKAIDICRRSAVKVENVLKIARAARDVIPREIVNLELIVNEVWVDMTSGMEQPPELVLHLHHDEPLKGERPTLKVILENLISNAVRFQDPGKADHFVEINSRSEENILHVSVKDNGIGIPDSAKDSIFDLFSRIDERSGDGLGLSLVRKHVERMNGSINVDSSAGRGTTFTFSIPVTQGAGDENSDNRR